MTDAVPHDLDAIPAPPPPGLADAVDEALVGLPAPPRVRTRVLGGLLTAVSAASVFLAWQLHDDVRFAFSAPAPIELGVGSTVDLSQLAPNRMVHLTASPEMAGAVRYSRPLFPGEYVVFPIAGRSGEPLYVQSDGATATSGDFTGRLIPFDGAGGRYARVGHFLRSEMSAPMGAHTYLLVAGVTPRSTWWAPALASFLLALALSDLLLLARLLRPADDEA